MSKWTRKQRISKKNKEEKVRRLRGNLISKGAPAIFTLAPPPHCAREAYIYDATLMIVPHFTDQLFTGTGTGSGYCSERSDTFGEATALLSVLCSSRSTWLDNSPTFGRVPVSDVSGMMRRVCPRH
ncbi:hypothetical protein J6590_073262 [Homalodisca vitripennis]|nr:hypothetical protein J6590_073262 [Homalodisca vitripennis]